jgi:hypothetical protein
MPESENAIDYAARVAAVPQIHFSGADDMVVPPAIARQFALAAGGRCTRVQVVPHASHDSDWSRYWPALLTITPACFAEADNRIPRPMPR